MRVVPSNLPGWRLVRETTLGSAGHDIVAGVLLTAVLIPAGMGYAQATGLPPVTGLYATIFPLLAYAFVGPSRLLVLGPDSSLTAIIAAVVIPLSNGDSQRAVALASSLALAAGVLSVIAGFVRVGFLTDLLSLPVRQGYLGGIAVIVTVGQLPKLFGFSSEGASVFAQVRNVVRRIGDGRTDTDSLLLGATALLALLLLRRVAPRMPAALLVVIGSIIVVSRFGLQVPVLGPLPVGLPSFTVPRLDRSDWGEVLTGAFGIAMVTFADSSVLSRTFASRTGQRVDPNHELVAIGVANAASGLFQGFSVSASASRTPVAESAGSKSQLTGIVSALTIGGLLLWGPTLLRNLPISVLAAIVLAAALQLFDVPGALRLFRARRSEFVLMAVAFLGVVMFGAIEGVGLAIGVSVLNFLRKAWWPHFTELVRIDGLKGYHDADRHPEGRSIPGLVLFRFDGPLFFANAEVFRSAIMSAVESAPTPTRRVVVTAEPITDIDATGAATLTTLLDELRGRGVTLAFAELKGHVRDAIVPYGLVERIGLEHFHRTVGESVKAYITDEKVDWVDWEDRTIDS